MQTYSSAMRVAMKRTDILVLLLGAQEGIWSAEERVCGIRASRRYPESGGTGELKSYSHHSFDSHKDPGRSHRDETGDVVALAEDLREGATEGRVAWDSGKVEHADVVPIRRLNLFDKLAHLRVTKSKGVLDLADRLSFRH